MDMYGVRLPSFTLKERESVTERPKVVAAEEDEDRAQMAMTDNSEYKLLANNL